MSACVGAFSGGQRSGPLGGGLNGGALLQHGVGGFTSTPSLGWAWRAWSAPVAASGRLLPIAVEVVPFRVAAIQPPFPAISSRSRWSRYGVHGETTVVIPRHWWRKLMGSELCGARWSVQGRGFFGVRRNPCWTIDTDAVMPVGAGFPS
jgi:hypothetical protein